MLQSIKQPPSIDSSNRTITPNITGVQIPSSPPKNIISNNSAPNGPKNSPSCSNFNTAGSFNVGRYTPTTYLGSRLARQVDNDDLISDSVALNEPSLFYPIPESSITIKVKKEATELKLQGTKLSRDITPRALLNFVKKHPNLTALFLPSWIAVNLPNSQQHNPYGLDEKGIIEIFESCQKLQTITFSPERGPSYQIDRPRLKLPSKPISRPTTDTRTSPNKNIDNTHVFSAFYID